MRARSWVVAAHADGVPDVARIYRAEERELPDVPGPGQLLLRTRYVSVDPYLHGLALATPLGEYVIADSVMEVVAAGPRARSAPGDLLQGYGGWRSHLVCDGAPDPWPGGPFPMPFPRFRRLDPGCFDEKVPLPAALGVLGGPGLTAWGTVRRVLRPRPGETLLVSGAGGTIGAVAAGLARRAGARVVGTTSTPGKEAALLAAGCHEVVLYAHGDPEEQVRERLRAALPDGVDAYLDNLGGTLTDVVFTMLRPDSRVAVNWQWSTQVGGEEHGPRLLPLIMFPRTTVRGIFATEWATPSGWRRLTEEVGDLVRQGAVSAEHTVHHGFDAIPGAYDSLFHGREANRGKVVVEL